MAEPALLPHTPRPAAPETGTRPAAPPLRLADDAKGSTAAGLPGAPTLELPSYDLGAALALEQELGIGHVLSQVLVRRALTDPAAAREFLDPKEEHPAGTFQGIEGALETITRHVAAGSRITIHGDYDVDGVCATAIMVRGLGAMGATVDWFLPGRMEDGYGLQAGTIGRLAARGTRLLITVDCGITAVEEVALARAAGVDVVVCDHHHARSDGSLPAFHIVHPSVCGYSCSDLCGTAVAHKLIEALGTGSDQDLELVALATVADLMPLRG